MEIPVPMTANTLQNNTVLSLYEDNQNNIWVALDRGLAYIRYIVQRQ